MIDRARQGLAGMLQHPSSCPSVRSCGGWSELAQVVDSQYSRYSINTINNTCFTTDIDRYIEKTFLARETSRLQGEEYCGEKRTEN